MLAPEERNRVEALASPQDVARRDLTLALGDDPMFHADAVAGMRIRPSRDIPGSENAGRGGLEEFVDQNAAIERKAGSLGEHGRRTHADAHHREVGINRPSTAQLDDSAVDRRDRLPQVKDHAVSFV